MSIEHEVRADGVVHTVLAGVVTAEEYAAHPFALVSDPRVGRPHRELFDARAVVDIQIPMSHVREAARLPGAVEELLSGARIAVLATDPASYGLGRAFQVLAEPAGATVLVTDDIDEAEGFLRQ